MRFLPIRTSPSVRREAWPLSCGLPGMTRTTTLLGALLAGALLIPSAATAGASPPSCFGGQGGTYNPFTKVGTGKSELIVGTEGNHVIYAGGGDDVILGLGGDDILCGAGGADRIAGGDGRDWIDGADDPMAYRAEAGRKTDDRADVISGGAGNDNAGGLDGDDFIDGGDGNDEIGGGRGRDLVIGGSGNDSTYG